MKRLVVGVLALGAVAAPVAAQQSTFSNKPAIFSIAPYVGYMNFGDNLIENPHNTRSPTGDPDLTHEFVLEFVTGAEQAIRFDPVGELL